MNRGKNKFLNKVITLCRENGILLEDTALFAGFFTINLNFLNWVNFFEIASIHAFRFVALYAEEIKDSLHVTVCLEFANEYLLIKSKCYGEHPEIPSITTYYAIASRFERHCHDLLGINFIGSLDKRRWTRHKAWSEKEYPLRKSYPMISPLHLKTPPDNDYPFIKASGSGVYEIPVGPVHAGIIEPGHFRFQAAGEDIINLEEHLGYVHKGIEKIAEGRDVFALAKLAGRVSGDSTVSHTWATCLALENATNLSIPDRSKYLRAILAESERVANHIGDFAAICNDVGFSFAYYQLMRIKELWLRTNKKIFGSRLLMDTIIPGGVSIDLDQDKIAILFKQIQVTQKELKELYVIFEDNSSLHDRLKNTGILTHEKALNLGVVGYLGKASGINFDLRKDLPYFPYTEIKVKIPLFTTGDVLSRVRVRAQEILISLELIETFLKKIPEGAISVPWQKNLIQTAGIGLIEGWRGEIFTYVSLNENGLVDRFFPRDPSWFYWPALEELIHGNIVPDFPVCNKSVNGTYSGVDL